MNALAITLILLSAAPMPEMAQPGVFLPNATVGELLTEAGESNPRIQAAWHRWEAALERIPQVTSFDDPMVTFGGFLLSDASRFKLGLSQEFPWFGTRRVRGDQAAAKAEAVLDELFAVRDEVFEEVKLAYVDLMYAAQQLDLIESQESVWVYMQDIVASKMSLGMSWDSDLLRVTTERTRLEDRREALRSQVRGMTARLNNAIGRDLDTPAPEQELLEFPPDPPHGEDLETLLETHAPTLARLDHLIDAEALGLTLAEKMGKPDFSVGLDYTAMSTPRQARPDRPYPASLSAGNRVFDVLRGASPYNARMAVLDAYALATSSEPMTYRDDVEDSLMVSLSVRVPIWRAKVRAAKEEARQLTQGQEWEREAQRRALSAAAVRTAFDYRDAKRRNTLFEESLIPQARALFDSLQSQYATGAASGDFVDLLGSITDLLAMELEQIQTAQAQQQYAVVLERILGTSWNDDDPNDE